MLSRSSHVLSLLGQSCMHAHFKSGIHLSALNLARRTVLCLTLSKNCIAPLAYMNMPQTNSLLWEIFVCWHSPMLRQNYKLYLHTAHGVGSLATCSALDLWWTDSHTVGWIINLAGQNSNFHDASSIFCAWVFFVRRTRIWSQICDWVARLLLKCHFPRRKINNPSKYSLILFKFACTGFFGA